MNILTITVFALIIITLALSGVIFFQLFRSDLDWSGPLNQPVSTQRPTEIVVERPESTVIVNDAQIERIKQNDSVTIAGTSNIPITDGTQSTTIQYTTNLQNLLAQVNPTNERPTEILINDNYGTQSITVPNEQISKVENYIDIAPYTLSWNMSKCTNPKCLQNYTTQCLSYCTNLQDPKYEKIKQKYGTDDNPTMTDEYEACISRCTDVNQQVADNMSFNNHQFGNLSNKFSRIALWRNKQDVVL